MWVQRCTICKTESHAQISKKQTKTLTWISINKWQTNELASQKENIFFFYFPTVTRFRMYASRHFFWLHQSIMLHYEVDETLNLKLYLGIDFRFSMSISDFGRWGVYTSIEFKPKLSNRICDIHMDHLKCIHILYRRYELTIPIAYVLYS